LVAGAPGLTVRVAGGCLSCRSRRRCTGRGPVQCKEICPHAYLPFDCRPRHAVPRQCCGVFFGIELSHLDEKAPQGHVKIINESAAMATNSVRRLRCWSSIAGLLCAYGSITSAGFAAEAETPPPQQVVRIGDLNLRDSRGVAVAYSRLLWAAERVCPFADSSDYWVRESATPCVIQAVSRAVAGIGSPQLSAYTQSQPLFRLQQTQPIARR
jgi:UrcA family protein